MTLLLNVCGLFAMAILSVEIGQDNLLHWFISIMGVVYFLFQSALVAYERWWKGDKEDE